MSVAINSSSSSSARSLFVSSFTGSTLFYFARTPTTESYRRFPFLLSHTLVFSPASLRLLSHTLTGRYALPTTCLAIRSHQSPWSTHTTLQATNKLPHLPINPLQPSDTKVLAAALFDGVTIQSSARPPRNFHRPIVLTRTAPYPQPSE
jgi:hypothetical protein